MNVKRIVDPRATVGRVLAFLLLVPGALNADTESPRITLGPFAPGLHVGPGMKARGENLYGCEFIGQDLTGANFDDCSLQNVAIHDCNLSKASFRRAVFTGARVSSCTIDGADFTDAIINGLQSWDGPYAAALQLSRIQLMSTHSFKRKDLRECVISGSTIEAGLDLRNFQLQQSTLIDGNFSTWDFSNSQIYRLRLINSAIGFNQMSSTADFRHGWLHIKCGGGGPYGKAFLGDWDFSGIDLRGSELSITKAVSGLTDAIISDCQINGGLTKEHLYSTRSFKEGNLTRLFLSRSDLSQCDLSNQNLTGAKFSKCDFTKANFRDAVVTSVDFAQYREWGCRGLTAEQIKSTWNYKHNRMQGIVLPKGVVEALRRK